MKFHVFCDPGHGWIRVPRLLLQKLGISSLITRYSYQRGAFAYLEEDCDADTFFKAYKAHFNAEPVTVTTHSNGRSRIRSYESYRP